MTDRTVVYRIEAQATQFKAQMAAASASVKGAADQMTGATKEGEKWRKGLDSAGATAGKFGLVAAAGLGAAVLKAADFDAAMSNVQAATHESAGAMDSLREAALKAGADTAFSATEAAAGIENLAKAGISTEDILGGALAGSLDLAAAGGIDVATAAEAAAGALAQFNLEGGQATHVADLLSAASGKAQGDVGDMVMALKQAGTVSAQTGLSIEETTGSLAALAEQSLLGSDAGTSFKQFLASLTPNSKKAADAMDALGLSAFDAQGNFIGMAEFAGKMQTALSGMTNEQRMATMETIFGSDAVRAASIIYDNGADGIQGWIDKTNDSGYAAETAAIKLDNLKGDVEALGGSLETALIGTGSGSQGFLRSTVQSLTDVVNAYNKLGEGAKSGVAITLAATAALGGGLFVFSRVVQSVAATRTALTQLGITATATKGKLAAVGGFLGGPWGLALLAGTVALGSWASKQAEAEARVNALTEALDAQTGDLNDNADAVVARQLIDEGWDDEKLKQYGTSIEEMTQAVLGDIEAFNALAIEIESTKGGLGGLLGTSDQDDIVAAMMDVRNGLHDAKVEQESLAGATSATTNATDALTAKTGGLAAAAYEAADATESFKDKLDRLNAVLEGRASLRDYEAALDDFTGSLKENGKTFDINTAKGRANQAALDNIAGSALKVAESMGKADRQKFLTNAIVDIRRMGENMGLPKAEVQRLITLLREANQTNVKPNIDANTGPALAAIASLEARLRNIADEDVFVNVRHREYGRNSLGPVDKAAGGYISGPGTATSDSIPAYLSNGEYVIKAAAVDKYGTHMFDHLNAMRFADGGGVGRPLVGRPVMDGGGTGRLTKQSLELLLKAAEKQAAAAAGLQDAAGDQQSAAQSSYDAAVAQRDAAGKAAVAGFSTGLFSRDSNVWADGAGGGALHNLNRDIAGLTERQGLIGQLSSAGISGTALEALLGEGTNADITGLIASGQLGQYASAYGQREALQGSTAVMAGNAAHGQAVAVMAAPLAEANAHLAQMTASAARMEQRVEHQTRVLEQQAERFAEALNGAARKARRDKTSRGR